MRNKTDAKQRVAVVTGSSRGIGLEPSLTLAEEGFTVYATVRNIGAVPNICHTCLTAAIRELHKDEGRYYGLEHEIDV